MPERPKDRKRKPRQTKDKVLQARIPEDLDHELRGRAASLGLSVSTIVRNVLMHTFDLVEGVVMDSTELVRTSRGGKRTPVVENREPAQPAGRRDAVVAWQQAALNLNAVCDQCNAILAKGQLAAIGIPIPARPVFLCLDCLAALTPDSTTSSSRK
jgi:plasmid stability protein